MKTIELTGRALDYAVALAEGWTNLHLHTPRGMGDIEPYLVMDYTRDDGKVSWEALGDMGYVGGSEGDDIIDRERISTQAEHGTRWLAFTGPRLGEYKPRSVQYGATRREAAMRCFIASKLGDEVDIPKELT